MAAEKTFTQEQVRYFLEQMGEEMRAKYEAQLPAAMTLFDAIMEPGARCEASKEVFRQWFNNLFFFAVGQTVTERGRGFLGVDVVKPEPKPDEDPEDQNRPAVGGYYAY